MADKIALMSFGKLLQYGEPIELYRRPNCAEVADFFGSVNWLSGTLIAPKLVHTKIGRFEVCAHSVTGPDVLVGFRPEALQVVEQTEMCLQNSFEANLRSSIFLGDQFVYEAVFEDLLLIGKSRQIPISHQHCLRLRVEASDIMVFPCSEKKESVMTSNYVSREIARLTDEMQSASAAQGSRI